MAVKRRALVIGLDAVRLDVMLKLLGEGRIPNLERMSSEGVFIRGKNEIPTVSATNWLSILSSVSAKTHKADTRNNEKSFTRAKRHHSFPPLFYERLIRQRPDLQSAVFSAWNAFFDHCIMDKCDVGYTPNVGLKNEPNWRALYDDDVIKEATRFLSGKGRVDPDISFVLLEEGDAVGEQCGFGSDIPEYVNACINYDRRVGLLLQAIQGRGEYQQEEWLVMVATDHGGYTYPEDEIPESGDKGAHLRTTPATRTVWAIYNGLGPTTKLEQTTAGTDLLGKDTPFADVYSEKNCEQVRTSCLDFIVPVIEHMMPNDHPTPLGRINGFGHIEGTGPFTQK